MNELNKLKLNIDMLTSLYGHSIVSLSEPATTAPTAVLSNKTIVFFRDSHHAKLPDRQFNFLKQILQACKLNITDVEMINIADNNVNLENIINLASPRYVLSFGTGNGTELFTMNNNRGTKYLNAPDLSELMQETPASKQLKGKLWTELKAIFNL